MFQRQKHRDAPTIIALASEGGGADKSILAVNLATLRAAAGRKVLLIDADAKQPSRIWGEKRCIIGSKPQIPVRRIAGKGVEPELENLVSRYDDIVIDTEGRDCLGSRSALVAARTVVIPIQPDQFNAQSSEALLRRIETARIFNPRLQVLFVIKCLYSSPTLQNLAAARALVTRITSARLANTTLYERVSMRRSFSEGQSILEYRPIDEAAIAETQNLYRDVYDTSQSAHPAPVRMRRAVLNGNCP